MTSRRWRPAKPCTARSPAKSLLASAVFALASTATKPAPPCQQVGAGLLQLAGDRLQEHEPQTAVFDETMHLVEERGQPLDLIHHDRRAPRERPQLVGKERRIAWVRLIEPFV